MKTLLRLAMVLTGLALVSIAGADDTDQYRYETLNAWGMEPDGYVYIYANDRSYEWDDSVSFDLFMYNDWYNYLSCYYYGPPTEGLEIEIPFSADSGEIMVDTSQFYCYGNMPDVVVNVECEANDQFASQGTEIIRFLGDDTTYTEHFLFTRTSADCLVWVVDVTAMDANGELRSGRSMDHESRNRNREEEDED